MAEPVMYRFEDMFLRNRSAVDASQVPYLIQLDLYRQGATVQADAEVPGDPDDGFVVVYEPGDIRMADTVAVGPGGPRFTVLSINDNALGVDLPVPVPGRSKLKIKSNRPGTVFIPAGSRLIVLNRRPVAYRAPSTASPMGSTILAAADGRVAFYANVQRFDYIARGIFPLVSSSQTIRATNVLSWTHPGSPLQNAIIVAVSWHAFGGQVQSVHYGSSQMASLGVVDQLEMFRLYDPPSGPQLVTVTLTPPGTPSHTIVAGAVSLGNADSGSSIATATASGVGNADVFVNVPSSSIDASVLAALGLSTPIGSVSPDPVTPLVGQTELWDLVDGVSQNSIRGAVSERPAGVGPTEVGWTFVPSAPPHPWRIMGIRVPSTSMASTRQFENGRGASVPTHSGLNLRNFSSLQTAIDALPAYGGEILIPSGTYDVPFPGVILTKPNVTLRGEGNSSVLRAATPNPSYDLIRVATGGATDGDFFRIDGVCLDGRGSSAGPGGSVLRMDGNPASSRHLPGCFLRNVTILNARKHALWLRNVRNLTAISCHALSGWDHAVRIENAILLRFLGLVVRWNSGRGVLATGNSACLMFLGGWFEANRGGSGAAEGNAIDVNLTGTSAGRVDVIGCTCDHADTPTRAAQFIYLAGAPASAVDGCYFQGRTMATKKPTQAVHVASTSAGTRLSDNVAENMLTNLVTFATWGYEQGNREVGLDAPRVVGPPFSLRSVRDAVNNRRAGVAILYSYSSATRPAATSVPVGSMIWYSEGSVRQVQVSDGTNWLVVGP